MIAQWPDKYLEPFSLTTSQKQQIGDLVVIFPEVFKQAQADWAKFKAGMSANLFPINYRQQVATWYVEFPKLWQTVRPNWEIIPGGTISTHRLAFKDDVDAWVAKLTGDQTLYQASLGIAPLIIAGVLIAAAFGAAGALWAVGYVKKQANITRLIDGVTSGKIPADVLHEAIKEEQNSGGLLGNIKGILIAGAALYALLTFAPTIRDMIGTRKKATA